MGYRDELDAARERIDTLERDNAALRANLRAKRDAESGAARTAGLGVAVLVASAALAVTWMHARALAEASADLTAQLGQREEELASVRRHLATERDGCARCEGHPDADSAERLASWLREEAVTERWAGHVTEAIGPAPVSADDTCEASVERRRA